MIAGAKKGLTELNGTLCGTSWACLLAAASFFFQALYFWI